MHQAACLVQIQVVSTRDLLVEEQVKTPEADRSYAVIEASLEWLKLRCSGEAT